MLGTKVESSGYSEIYVLRGNALYLDYDAQLDFKKLGGWWDVYVADVPLDQIATITNNLGSNARKIHFVTSDEAKAKREEDESFKGFADIW